MLSHEEYLNLLQETITKFHREEILPSDIPKAQHESLLPTLRPYQLRAVNWMLARELYPAVMDQEHEVKLPSGGILADEMGLGKTVEVIACILANPRTLFDNEVIKEKEDTKKVKIEEKCTVKVNRKRVRFNDGDDDCIDIPVKICKYDDVEIDDTVSATIEEVIENVPKHDDVQIIEDTVTQTIEEVIEKYSHPKKRKVSGVRTMLQNWYDNKLSEMKPTCRRQKPVTYNDKPEVKCCCIQDVDNDETVQCPKCKTYQHSSCVGYVKNDASHEYFCFNCWKEQPPVQSGATVIVSPESICNQWKTEIEKHTVKDGLKVLVYNGVRVNGYIQPPKLAQYDIIITTYEVLRKEIYFTTTKGRQLRHAKRFFAPTSPLTCVQWWRLCLDEAQMVEGVTTKTAEMAKKFNVIHKWAVTGTPIQKSVHDLHGLIKFLDIVSYSNLNHWKDLVSDTDSFLEFIPRVLWRTPKKDVLEELGVPEQKTVPHWLEFSTVEAYFYETQHEECSTLFVEKIARFKDWNLTLNRIDGRLLNSLVLPLLRLRQACSHPQAVRGQFLTIKKTMTMRDLLCSMVDKTKLECEETLRQTIASLNGMAGLTILQEEYQSAVLSYREVLHLSQEHKGKLKVDSLQKIHTMHNLAEVLETYPEDVISTRDDFQLRTDLAKLEQNYMDKREYSIKNIKESVDKYADNIKELCNGRSFGYSEWWLNVLERTEDSDELLNKIKTNLERTDILEQHQHHNLTKKLCSLPAVRIQLANWLAKTESRRQKVLSLLNDLENTSVENLADVALVCHLSPGSRSTKSSKCDLCKCESALKDYEGLIFEERNKIKRHETQRNKSQKQTEAFTASQKNKGVADLIDVNLQTSEFSKKGGMKASQHEQVLKDLKSYSRSKHMPSEISQDATQHLKLLGLLKKEFLYLNNYWTHISEQVLARDELNMAKIRLRLPYPHEENDESALKNKQNIVQPYKVSMELYQLQCDKAQSKHKLKSKLGTLLYLENLQREGDSATTTCPICRNNLSDKWSVLQCGHCLCLECLPMMLLKQSSNSLPCVQCRQVCDVADISYVLNSENEGSQLKGSYSTKVEAVMTTLMDLREADPFVKVLVFSAWEKVLDVIAEGFKMNDITFRRLSYGKAKTALEDFKTKDVSALLMSLSYGAKGLNLVEATHVFLVEPMLNPYEELQAIGRVHRIGQTRETFVHRFVVKDTIEERMRSAIDASNVELWIKKEITLQQLYNIFSPKNTLNTTNPVSQATTSFVEDQPTTS